MREEERGRDRREEKRGGKRRVEERGRVHAALALSVLQNCGRLFCLFNSVRSIQFNPRRSKGDCYAYCTSSPEIFIFVLLFTKALKL